jgi:hypothetical protein
MDHKQAQKIATENKLGQIHFQFNVAQNTGREFEVGYVFVGGRQVLFCKRGHKTAPDQFYLCNEFRALEKSDA